jgi:predicted negative regulator of RcsB-dependent stress response
VELNLVEDDEQEKAKQWWRANRVPIISGIVLGLSIIIGFNWWDAYTISRAEAASALYQQLLIGDASGDRAGAIGHGEGIIADYADTPYAGKAALILARISYQDKDAEAARRHLQWAIDNVSQFETVHTARLNLAAILYDEQQYQQALELLSVVDMQGYESHYFEMRGDVLVKLGEQEKARSAYRAAIDGLAAGSLYEPVLRMKLDAIAAPETKQ